MTVTPLRPSFWCGILLALMILAGSFYNLANYPAIWWDEGIFSETAANLVQHGRYAFTEQSPDQLSDLDFRISVGPMVILPVALAYKLFGVGLVPGRVVAGAYLALAFLGLYLAARHLWGARAALVAVALAVVGTDAFFWGRSVLGDVPALALFLWALFFLIPGLKSPRLWPLFLGGIFLGLAFDAKEFYGLAFLPPPVILLQQNWADKRRLCRQVLAFLAGATVPLFAFLLLKTIILGSLTAAVLHFLAQKKILCHEFFTPLTIGRIYPESLIFLLKHPLFWLGLLGTFWVWKKEPAVPGARLWLYNFLLWSLIYLTAVYWHRFALPGLFLASPLAAHFLLTGIARLQAGTWFRPSPWATLGALLVFFALYYPVDGLDYLKQTFTCNTSASSRLVHYLRTHVPPRYLIETPEYELIFLDDDHPIHLMPSYFFVESTPDRTILYNPRRSPYDFNQVGAQILILGKFGKSVFQQIYPPAQINQRWRRVAQVDFYDIYVSRHSDPRLLKLLTGKPTIPQISRLANPGGTGHAPEPFIYSFCH